MSKHTQGEWKVGKSEIFRPASTGSISPYYQQICSFVENGSEECKANAKLIAAAPDLLKALEGLLKWNAHLPLLANNEILKATEAIKKATL